LKPTGNKDPFALRRNALGLARTLIEGGLDLDLQMLLEMARDAVGAITVGNASASADVNELRGFIIDRLRSYYGERDVPIQQFEAVAAVAPASLLDFDRRLAAIGEFATLPEAEALAAANKRIRNILRKAEGGIPASIDPALLTPGAEQDLADAVAQAMADTDDALARRDYVAVLGRLARLRPQVDAFFDAVMVNVDDTAMRNNRLALLQRLADRLGSVAAIEHLSA
jgi:glycyl-tRNA synthetase beta chain